MITLPMIPNAIRVYSLVIVISVPAGTVRAFTDDSLRIGFVIVATLVNFKPLREYVAYEMNVAYG